MQLASSLVVGRPLLGFSNTWPQLIRTGRSHKAKQRPRKSMSLKWFFWVSCSCSWPWPAPWPNGFLDMFSVTMDHCQWQDLWIRRLWSWNLVPTLGCRSYWKVAGAKGLQREAHHHISLPTWSQQWQEKVCFRYKMKTQKLTQDPGWVLKSKSFNQNFHRTGVSCTILVTTQRRHVALEFTS